MTLYQLLKQWRDSFQGDSDSPFLHDEFGAFYSVRQSYERIGKIASYLYHQGMRPGHTVALALQRNADQVLLPIALNQLGASFVYIDATNRGNPDTVRHIAAVLTETPLDYVLTHDEMLTEEEISLSQKTNATQVIHLDSPEIRNEIIRELPLSEESLKSLEVSTTGVGYYVYSSGTTGQPKGMAVPEAGLKEWVPAIQQLFVHMDDHDNNHIMTHISVSFDPALWDILVALVKRCQLTVVSAATKNDPDALIDLMKRARITDAVFVPTVARALNLKEQLPTLVKHGFRGLQSTGEAFDRALLNTLFNETPQVTPINLFGSSEEVFGSAGIVLTPKNVINGRVPIGLPVEGTRWHVFKEDDRGEFKSVRDGDVGELFVEKPHMAKYLDPKDEHDKFKTLIISGRPVKCFREGVLVSYQKELNCYQYHGRTDALTFKLNGTKINVLETEQKLHAHPNILSAAVVVPSSLKDTPQVALAAVVVCKNPLIPMNIMDLRQYLRDSGVLELANPAFLHLRYEMPFKDLNGKLDRRKLADEAKVDEMDAYRFSMPANEIEREIQQIWFRYLKNRMTSIDEISCNKPFYLQGGISLQLQDMTEAVKNKFGVHIDAADFQHADAVTIRQYARFVQARQKTTATADGTPKLLQLLKSHEVTRNRAPIDFNRSPIFLLPGITGDDSQTFQRFVQALDTDGRPVYVVKDPAFVFDDTSEMTLKELATLYRNTMREVQPTGPLRLIGWSFGCSIAWLIASMEEMLDCPPALLGLIDGIAPHPIKASDKDLNHKEQNHNHLKRLIKTVMKISSLLQHRGVAISFSGLDESNMSLLIDLPPKQQIDEVFRYVIAEDQYATTLRWILRRNLMAHSDFSLELLGSDKSALQKIKSTPCVVSCTETLAGLDNENRSLWWDRYCRDVTSTTPLEGDHFSILSDTELANYFSEKLKSYTIAHEREVLVREVLRDVKGEVLSAVREAIVNNLNQFIKKACFFGSSNAAPVDTASLPETFVAETMLNTSVKEVIRISSYAPPASYEEPVNQHIDSRATSPLPNVASGTTASPVKFGSPRGAVTKF